MQKRITTFSIAVIAGLVLAGNAMADSYQINVYTALAPNAFGSPSYPAWEANAVNAMKQGLTTNGTAGTPTFFETQTIVNPADLTVTSFPSWRGTADPGTAFGPAFANELGNRGAFPLYINGNGGQFSISQLSFAMTSSDVGNSLGFAFALGSYNYGTGYVGILKGADNTLGTLDDLFVTGGANTQLVDGLAGRGSGNALWPCGPGDLSPCGTVAEQQAAIDNMAAILAGKAFTGTYTLGDSTGSASFAITPSAVPEPGSMVLFGSALLMFAGLAYKKRQRLVRM